MVDKTDEQFLDDFFADELSVELMEELDRRLHRPDFELMYQQRLAEKYDRPAINVLASYLPMIVLIILVVVGVVLLLSK